MARELKPYGLWIADYSKSGRAVEKPATPESYGWTLWQFTEKASLSVGNGNELDATIFKGTDGEFKKSLGFGE
jgi:lysozyme